MGHNPDGSTTIRTLGDLAECGMRLSAYCENYHCRRTLPVTVSDLVRIFGKDWPFYDRKPPIKCAECGSNRIDYIVSPIDTTGQPRPR